MKYETGIQIIDDILEQQQYDFLGKGMNGFALKIKLYDKDCVLKFTNSAAEFKLTRKVSILQNKNKENLKYSAKIYHQFRLSNFKFQPNIHQIGNYQAYKFLIITEYLTCSDKLKKYFEKHVFGSLISYCFTHKMLLSDFIQLPKQNYLIILKLIAKDSINYKDLQQLVCILKLHHTIGSGDFHSGNLGYDKDGNIKAFDFDELQIKK